MKARNSITILLSVVGPLLFGLTVVQAQVSKETLDSISIPDKVETSIGLLEFFDGVPSDATIESLYDNLDRTRGLGVYLDNMGNWLQTVPGKSWFPVSTNRRRRQV